MSSRLVLRSAVGPPLHLSLPQLHLSLPHLHLLQVRAVRLVVYPVAPWLLLLLQWPRFLRIAQLDERGDVRLRPGLEVSSKSAVGRDSLGPPRSVRAPLLPRGGSTGVLGSAVLLQRTGYSSQTSEATILRLDQLVSTCPHRSTYSSCSCS